MKDKYASKFSYNITGKNSRYISEESSSLNSTLYFLYPILYV